jgi:hypothetical protein
MADYQEIKKELERYVGDIKKNPRKDPEVLALRGAWGVGKTYLYRKVATSLPKAKYISLFGINSLEEMKQALIFEKKGNVHEIAKDVSIKTMSKYTGLSDNTLQHLMLNGVRNLLVCIDDIERKGDELSIKDIMGFVDMLKEQHQCHIVLILNDGELDPDDEKEFNSYYEKVIDIAPQLSPSTREAAEKILGNIENKDYIINRCEQLNIANLRIIKKIKGHIEKISESIKNCNIEAKQSLIASLIFLTWVHEMKGKGKDNTPTMDYVTGKDHANAYGGSLFPKDDEEEEKQREKLINEYKKKSSLYDPIIRSYGFDWLEQRDAPLQHLAECGYLTIEKLKNGIDYTKAFCLIHNQWKAIADAVIYNIDASKEAELIERFYKITKKSIPYLNFDSVTKIDTCITYCRAINKNEWADELILFTIQNAQQNQLYIGTDFPLRCEDGAFIEKITQYNIAFKPSYLSKPLIEVLRHVIAQGYIVNDAERTYFSERTKEEFIAAFDAMQGNRELDGVVYILLHETGQHQKSVRLALYEIGQRSYCIGKNICRLAGVTQLEDLLPATVIEETT